MGNNGHTIEIYFVISRCNTKIAIVIQIPQQLVIFKKRATGILSYL